MAIVHCLVLRRLDLQLHATDRIRRDILADVMVLVAGGPAVAAIVFHNLTYIPYGGIVQVMNEKLKKSQLARLGRIEGQVRGIARMIEEERYCIDVLTQIRAVRAALNKVEQETLGDHLEHCVARAFHAGSEKDRKAKIEEILDVLDSRRS